jgi:hypothetical protein
MWRWNSEFSLGYSNSWTKTITRKCMLAPPKPMNILHTCLALIWVPLEKSFLNSKTMQHIHVKDSYSKDSMHYSPSWTALGQHLQHTPRLACSTLSASSMGSSITPAAPILTSPHGSFSKDNMHTSSRQGQHGLGQLLQHLVDSTCWTPSSTPPAAAPST